MHSPRPNPPSEIPSNPTRERPSFAPFANQVNLVHKAELNLRTHTYSNGTERSFANKPPVYGFSLSHGSLWPENTPLVNVQGSLVPDWDLIMREEVDPELGSRLRPFVALPLPVLSQTQERRRRRKANKEKKVEEKKQPYSRANECIFTQQLAEQQQHSPHHANALRPGALQATASAAAISAPVPLVRSRPAGIRAGGDIITAEQFAEVNLFRPETPIPAGRDGDVLPEVFPTPEQVDAITRYHASPTPSSPTTVIRDPIRRERSALCLVSGEHGVGGPAFGVGHRRRRSSISGPAISGHMPVPEGEEDAVVEPEE
ncbi:hypothetical protein K490DRAFT_68164 [Saccharata proteae CBS 121410]|uniref:Uncharacterized protein n=1 Tax=Saccharata proteae CBS 121410 TaxID=1314787 RepID=A0A9P4LUK4_9PEZI|nr:hypothetical protein K490DRAFT_68164 [Saccharata proteae CBS 121410]